MKEVKLPSGAVLKIGVVPFVKARALYQAILAEAKGIPISTQTEMAAVYKDLFCTGFSSQSIEAQLWICFERCTYNSGSGDFKISEDTFEPVSAREDYMSVCMEVAKEVVGPFVKSLYAEYGHILAMMQKDPT